MDQEPASRKREIITALAVLLVVSGIVSAVVVTQKKDNLDNTAVQTTTTAAGTRQQAQTAADATTVETPTDTGISAADGAAATNSSGYKDGTYTATGLYESPGGSQRITIRITLSNGSIVDTSASVGASDSESAEYQRDFINGYKQKVVGRSIDGMVLSRVSGSSLTSQGFNDAIDQIKQNAHA